jgi:chemotaxis receptor (MCP) glutamine deamidase CheD
MEVSLKLLQTWVGKEKIKIEKVATGMAIVIWDPFGRRCAATHFFSSDESKVEEKIRELINALGVKDHDFEKLRVKLAGGADVAGLQIGRKFSAAVINAIRKMKLPVGGYDIGGSVTRTVTFDPVSGRCVVYYLIGGQREI